MDTWRLAFRTSRTWPATTYPVFSTGEYRAQWFEGFGLLAMEGHPVADGLAAPTGLDAAYGCALDELERWGHRPTSFAGLSRLDSTVTLRFNDPAEGRAVLAGVKAWDWPRCEVVSRGVPARSLQIVHASGRAPLARVYDKGAEAGTAPPGELVRFEDQARFAAGRRPGRADFEPEYVRGRFVKRFGPMARAVKGVRVAGVPVIARALAERVVEGEMTYAEAERLGGYLLLEQAQLRGASRWTRRRRRVDLQAHGLVVADELAPTVDVDLGAVLDQAVDEAVWR